MKLRKLDKKYFGRQGKPDDIGIGNSGDSYLTDAVGAYIDLLANQQLPSCSCPSRSRRS